MMRKTLVCILFLLSVSAWCAGQISGAGQLGCNGAPVTGTAWTSATALNTTQILASGVAGTQLLVTLDQTTTITGGAITFLGDPGDSNFVTLAAWQVVDPTASPFASISLPYTLVASTNKQFLVLMYGMNRLQLKLSTAITGSATITPFTTQVCVLQPNLVYQPTGSNLNVSATFPSAQAVTQSSGPWTNNITQFAGSNVATGTGAGGAGIPRMTISNDSSLAANQSVNLTQINGVAPLVNNGASGAGSQRFNLASDNTAIANWGQGATGSAVPSGGQYLAGNGSGNLTGLVTCDQSAPINVTTATTSQVIAISGTGGRTYICAFDLIVSTADNVTLISGSGSNCASNVAAIIGGTTAANGWNFAANGGISRGNGVGLLWKTATTNNEVCLVTSATAVASGSITYTQF